MSGPFRYTPPSEVPREGEPTGGRKGTPSGTGTPGVPRGGDLPLETTSSPVRKVDIQRSRVVEDPCLTYESQVTYLDLRTSLDTLVLHGTSGVVTLSPSSGPLGDLLLRVFS